MVGARYTGEIPDRKGPGEQNQVSGRDDEGCLVGRAGDPGGASGGCFGGY